MFQIESLMLVSSILVLFAVASSKVSARLGLPVLVVFIGLGMLAGSEGLGGIAFENYGLANGIGTVALSLILFDGGLQTSNSALRLAWKPALTLATLGVVITALVTGLAAHYVLGISLLEGILLGSIVSSTDAAAVFSVLRGRGTRLSERLGATLEVESGSNDPMAVFLTVGLLEVLTGGMNPGWPLLQLFVLQTTVGAAAGFLVGKIGVAANQKINLDAAGLYPVMMAAVGVLAYGLAASFGGSGFLAVYIAGIVLGNSQIIFRRGIALFSDGMAWLSQIVMFTMLGLLSFPSRLLEVAPQGLILAAVLIFVARPLAVHLILPIFRFSFREATLVSWGGLRGAVPIILATFPLLTDLPAGPLLFNVVFFVVLISAMTQGWTLARVAAGLGLQQPARPEPPISLEITSLRHISGDIVDYLVPEGSSPVGRTIRELSLPMGAVVAVIARGQELIPPRGGTKLRAGDHVFLVMRPGVRQLVDQVFCGPGADLGERLNSTEFPLSPDMLVSELNEFYGIEVDAEPACTLEALLRRQHDTDTLRLDSCVQVGNIRLRVREFQDKKIKMVGLQVLADAEVTAVEEPTVDDIPDPAPDTPETHDPVVSSKA